MGRDRFLPVKTTNDLLLLRSDAYTAGAGRHAPAGQRPDSAASSWTRASTGRSPTSTRASPTGRPSLRAATRLAVGGDWTFGRDVVVVGDVALADTGSPEQLADGARLAP